MSSSDRNETIHHPRRPPLPEAGPEPQPPPSRRRMVAILAMAAVASLCAGYAVTVMLGSAGDQAQAPTTAPRTQTSPAVTRRPGGTLAATQPQTTTTPATGPGTAPGDAPPATPGTPAATIPAPAPPAQPAAPVADAGFDTPIPSGWREREFAVRKEGYLQSRWSDPKDARTYVIVDWADGDRRRPAEAAATLRAAVAGRTDYREVRFGPTRGKGWIWVYTILDDRGRRIARIDLLSRHCGILFAVLGSTPAKRFAALQRTFIAVSQGIRLKRRRC